MPKAIDFFLDLAKRGKHPGASSGEKRARRLALAILDNLPGLDDKAITGLVHFMGEAQMRPETARTSIDGWES